MLCCGQRFSAALTHPICLMDLWRNWLASSSKMHILRNVEQTKSKWKFTNVLAYCCFSIRGSSIDSTTITSFISDVPCSRFPSPRGPPTFSSSHSWLKRNDSWREDGRGTSSGGTYLRIKMETATMVNARSVPTLTCNRTELF